MKKKTNINDIQGPPVLTPWTWLGVGGEGQGIPYKSDVGDRRAF